MRDTSATLDSQSKPEQVLAGNCSGANRYVVLSSRIAMPRSRRSTLNVDYIGTTQFAAALAVESAMKGDANRVACFLVMPGRQSYVVETVAKDDQGRYNSVFPIGKVCEQTFSEMLYSVVRNESYFEQGLALSVDFNPTPRS